MDDIRHTRAVMVAHHNITGITDFLSTQKNNKNKTVSSPTNRADGDGTR